MQTLLLATFAFFLASSSIARASPPLDEVPQVSEYKLDEKEYADLKAYMNYARTMLENALKRAQSLGDASLYACLKKGIQDALVEARMGTGHSQDILLFRAVLERSLTIDSTYEKTLKSYDDRIAASSTMLLAGIYSALNYHKTNDSLRVAGSLVPAPDWAAFARDQIPVLLRMLDLAPTPQAQRQLASLALAWTLTDLNRSLSRRDYAQSIVTLGDAKKSFDQNRKTVAEAESLLIEVARTLNSKLSEDKTAESLASFPAENYPGTKDSIFAQNQSPTFPLVGVTTPSLEQEACDNCGINLGIGGGFARQSGQSDGFARISALAHYFMVLEKDPGTSVMITGHADLSTPFSNPSYRTKLNATGGVSVVGFWAALEANQYMKFKEEIMRGGLSVIVPYRMSEHSYIFVQLGGGASSFDGRMVIKEPVGDMTYAGRLQLILKLSKFFMMLEYARDWATASGSYDKSKIDRNALEATISIPVGVVLPNDGLRFSSRYTHFLGRNEDGQEKKEKILDLGAYYEVRF